MATSTLGFPYDSGNNGLGITDVPAPTREKKQRSLNADDILFTRYLTPWTRPSFLTAEQWRQWVLYQPIAIICRETMTANILAQDWQIVPRESKYRDELAATIKYYTKLIENGGYYYDGFDYTNLIEWLMTDYQDLSFGTGVEIGRKNDSPGGRVIWMKPIDGGTLYPTNNRDWPVIQYYHSNNVIWFPKHAIARMYMSPRTEILYEGWGMAPPEKIVMALEMLQRSDKYYANLLSEVPPAGILDLGDMEKDSALEWAQAFKSWSQGNLDAFAIPILYEHTGDAKFLQFGKVPNDLMYDRITLKYAAIVCASYGMSLGDIGLQAVAASGETLAGSIRSERKTKRTGFARAKQKIQGMFNRILPDSLEFKFTDVDDELSVSLGRARLANATAAQILIQNGMFDAAEMRLQTLEDGTYSINVPEEPPKQDAQVTNKNPERPGMLGYPQNASAGGQGEIRKFNITTKRTKAFDKHVHKFVEDILKDVKSKFEEAVKNVSEDDLYLVRSNIDIGLFSEDDVLGFASAIQNAWEGKTWLKIDEKTLDEDLHSVLESINDGVKDFIGKSVIYLLKNQLLVEDALDANTTTDYDSIVNVVSNKLIKDFDEFVTASVMIEAEKILEKEVKND